MALVEQTTVCSRRVNVVAGEDKFHQELQFLMIQLSEPAGQTLKQPSQIWPTQSYNQHLRWT